MRQVSNCRCRDYAGAGSFDFGGVEPGGKSVGHPATRFARVLPNNYAPWAGGKMIAQGTANCMHGLFIQRIFAGDAADSISAEKLSHHSIISTCYLVFSNSLAGCKWVRMGVTRLIRNRLFHFGGEPASRHL